MGADGRLFVLFAQLLWKFVEMVTFWPFSMPTK